MKMNPIPLAAVLTLPLVLLPAGVRADGDPAAGKQKAATCEACHGPTGIAIDPNYPNLAGQYESYLIKALADYRAGARTNAVMAGFAKTLSNQDIEDLASWFASLDGLYDLSIR